MNKEQMDKYAYELMVKNNPDEAVKQLLLKDKTIEKQNNIIREIREINAYIYNNLKDIDYGEAKCKINRALEILDKENKNE